MNQLTTRYCSHCGSPLILTNQVTEKLDGSQFPQTTSSYRCSDEACYTEQEKQKAKRMQVIKEKEIAVQKKTDAKLKEKRDLAALTEANASSAPSHKKK